MPSDRHECIRASAFGAFLSIRYNWTPSSKTKENRSIGTSRPKIFFAGLRPAPRRGYRPGPPPPLAPPSDPQRGLTPQGSSSGSNSSSRQQPPAAGHGGAPCRPAAAADSGAGVQGRGGAQQAHVLQADGHEAPTAQELRVGVDGSSGPMIGVTRVRFLAAALNGVVLQPPHERAAVLRGVLLRGCLVRVSSAHSWFSESLCVQRATTRAAHATIIARTPHGASSSHVRVRGVPCATGTRCARRADGPAAPPAS